MKLIVTAILTCIAAASFAQATGSSQLTLDDAIKLALEKNYTARTAADALSSAEFSRSKAGDALLPSVTGSGSYTYSDQLTSTLFYPNVPYATHGLSYRVAASLNLFNGGADAANISAAGYALDAAKYNLKWTRQVVAFNVISDYVNALRTKELRSSAELTYSQDTTQLTRVRAQYSAGAVAVNAVYQQEAVVGQDLLQLIQSKNNYANALADLLFQLNIAPSRYGEFDVSLAGIDTNVVTMRSKTGDMQVTPSAIGDLLDHREDFASQRANLLSQEESIKITKAALLPTLNASFGIGGSGANNTIPSIQLIHALSGSLTLSMPIFDKFQTSLQTDILNTQLDEGRIQLEQAEQQFRSDITKADNNLRSSQEALDASVSALTSAEESYRSATERLRVGAGIQVDVIVAQAALETARVNRVNAVYNYVLATKQLEYLLGRTNY
ncbi:MAG TPA: TolC family protein [Candidatus Kapabacteria bacterium]|nr:TolC family protein [Candidatus Kapabacteria bacterium]